MSLLSKVLVKDLVKEEDRFGDWTYSTDSSSEEVLARLTNREGKIFSWKRDAKPFDRGSFKSLYRMQQEELCISVASFGDNATFCTDLNEELVFLRLNEAFQKKETDHVMHSLMVETFYAQKYRVQIIIQPFFREGTLYGLIVPENKLSSEEREGKDREGCTAQVLKAISYLHENNIYHEDIKLNNFLVENNDKGRRIVLTDFSHTVFFSTEHPEATAALISSCQRSLISPYACPDILEGKNREEKNKDKLAEIAKRQDVWATGIVLYNCRYSRYPQFVNTKSGELTRDKLRKNLQEKNQYFINDRSKETEVALDKVIEKMFNEYLTPAKALEHLFPEI